MTVREMPEKDWESYATIAFNAYPGFGVPDAGKLLEFLQSLKKDKGDDAAFYGCYDGNKLVGGMIIYSYIMNFRGKRVNVSGVGFVAVDLTRKKEKICMEMIRHFVERSRDERCAFALLYPFRPDFYRKMGFGYSSSLKKYRISTGAFPGNGDKTVVRLAEPGDAGKLADFYNRSAMASHGMILRTEKDIARLIKGKMRVAVVEHEGAICGYTAFHFKKGNPDNFTSNDLVVKEMIHDTFCPDSALSLYAFLRSQKDQCSWTEFTTFDEELYHMLNDPRDSSHDLMWGVNHLSYQGGVGLMCQYTGGRELAGLLQGAVLGDSMLSVKFNTGGVFPGEEGQEISLSFRDGNVQLTEKTEVTVTMSADIFSSLIMGALSAVGAFNMGLLECTRPELLPILDGVLKTCEKPSCITEF